MMMLLDGSLFILGIILFFGLLIPQFFKRLHLPFATSLIIFGSLLGPHGLNYFQTNETLELFGFLGSAFLLLLAGINSKSGHFRFLGEKVLFASFINGVIPFLAAFGIVYLFGYSLKIALLMGVVLIASSTSLVNSTLKMLKIERHSIGKLISGVVVMQDMLSLLLLSLFLRNPEPRFPIIIYLGLLISSVLALRLFLPELMLYIFSRVDTKEDYEYELRTVISLLLIVVFIFSGIGVHPIVAAFLVGFAVADIIRSRSLINKLHTIGYGLFVPVFFFIVGMEMDLKILFSWDFGNIFLVVFIPSLILAKFVSGYIATRVLNYSVPESLVFGSATISRLTTTLSSTFIISAFDLLDNTLLTGLIFLVLLSTLISPLFSYIFAKKYQGEGDA